MTEPKKKKVPDIKVSNIKATQCVTLPGFSTSFRSKVFMVGFPTCSIRTALIISPSVLSLIYMRTFVFI